MTVDLALIDGVFELEFGVLTDCESSIEGSPEAEPAGLSVFPNPSNGAAFARLDGAVFDGRGPMGIVRWTGPRGPSWYIGFTALGIAFGRALTRGLLLAC